MMRRFSYLVVLSLTLVGTAAPEAAAQLADPSARSFGLAGAYSTRARGYEAVFWNPANLGMPDRPGWSVGLPALNAFVANNSLSYGEITAIYGDFLDDAEKSQILADIRRDDAQRMLTLDGDAGAGWLGFSIGPFAIAGGSIGTGTAELSTDAVELILFGNVGEDGQGKDFSFEGSNALGWSLSAIGASYGHGLKLPIFEDLGMDMAVGVTAKYLVAHGLGRVADTGSLLTQDPLAVNVSAEALHTNDAMAGSGWSADLAGSVKWGKLSGALVLKNIVGNVSWNEEDMELTLFSVTADFDSTTSTDTTLAFDELSPEDQERVRGYLGDASLPRRIRLGGKYQFNSLIGVSADYEEKLGGELRAGWDRTFATGAELNALSFLPLRIGLSTNFSEFAYAGGFGVYAGPVHFDFAMRRQGINGGDGLAGAVSLSIWPGMRQ